MNRSNTTPENVSPTELYHAISGAASQDVAQIQMSTTRLKEMLELSGAYDALHEIAAQRNLPLQVRQQSIIQFKNVALSHWKSRKMLSEEQRARIRSRSLTLVDEEDALISECNEVIIAKIARQDFPNNWPSLISDLMGIIETSLHVKYNSPIPDDRALLILRRTLRIVNEVLKEFSSIKMPYGIRAMGRIVEQLHLVLYSYYSKLAASFSSLNPTSLGSPQIANDLLLAHLVYKCLVKMTTWLWQRSDNTGRAVFEKLQPWFHEFVSYCAVQAKNLIELRVNLVIAAPTSLNAADSITRQSIDQLTRHVRLFGKFFRRLQQLSATHFSELPMCNDLVLYYWSNVVHATSSPPDFISDSNEAVFPVRFLVQALVLFKENLSQWTPQRKNGTPNENSLSQDFVENAVRLLVSRFIPLKPSDLEGWMSDPEEWVNLEDRENDHWEFELRPCSERVLMALCNQYQDYVSPLLELTFKQVVAQPTADLSSIIQKEAIYCAIGRCALRIKEVIPFEQWLSHTLAAEALETNPNYPIIKRRIAWLIGKWVGDMCAPADIPAIWEILVHLLRDRGPGTDAVVRLTAAVALKECVDALQFNIDVFAPFLPSIVTELIRLIDEADTPESKQRIVHSLNAVIERADSQIAPLVDVIAKALPQWWTSSGEDWSFKSSLLTMTMKLISSIKERSAPLSGIVVPLVRESLSPGAISRLDEDGLILWLAALRNTVTIENVHGSPALIDLFPLALSLLAVNLDLLGKIINICESYFILDGQSILTAHAVDLFRAFLTALKSGAIPLNVKDMVIALSLLVQITPSSLWGEALHVSGLFSYLLNTLLENEAQTTILTEHIYLLARIVIADRQMFLQLMSATASSHDQLESSLWEGLLDQWWNRFDNMSEPRHRKLTAMGIASLVSTGRPEVLHRLHSEIFNLWLDVFGEIKEARNSTLAEQDGIEPDPADDVKCYWEQNEPPHSYFQDSEGTPEYGRRRAIYDHDVVRTTMLTSCISAALGEAERACGDSETLRNLYLAKADPMVLTQIQNELIGA